VRALLLMDPTAARFVFGEQESRRLAEMLDVDLSRTETSLASIAPDVLARTELLITGWGSPTIDTAALEAMPALRAIVHWGGGVDFIAPVASKRGIAISSARDANAIPVAEFTIAMITLAAKDAFWVSRQYAAEQRAIHREEELAHTGLYNTSVGIVGASAIGSRVMEMLRSSEVQISVFDPFVSSKRAEELGATLIPDLVQLASRSRILSVHAPAVPSTRGMVSRDVLSALPDGATVINTSRGILIDQDALVDELQSGRIRAILDVTEPDVLPPGHPLYRLPNVFLTPHLAGSTGSELRRLGIATVAEVERLVAGRPFNFPITPPPQE